MNYKMVISYDGSRYNGWQKQKNTDNTIQGKIERCLTELLGENIDLYGSSRTDAGVHASSQVANFKTTSELSHHQIYQDLNRLLPEDIAVKSIEEATDRFHARLNSTGKVYSYRMYLRQDSPVFQRKYAFHHPMPVKVDVMKTMAEMLVGEHDFILFSDNKKTNKSSIKTISSIDFQEENGFLTITFKGNGFMYHMIRRMMGMMIHAGETNVIPNDIFSIKEWPKEWPLAPAKGLTLENVIF